MFKRIAFLALAVVLLAAAPARETLAERGISIIRDAEVESTIRSLATPLFQAGGISPDSVRIHIVQDSGINAFVAGGMNMFINTGLLLRTETPGQLIGVMAHEAGHIVGGHLVNLRDEIGAAQTRMLVSQIAGIAAAIATGRGDVGAAVGMAGTDAAVRGFLAFSRAQEQAADQAAVRMLDATGQSSRGLLEFFEILGDQELLVTERQDPYVRTHPLTSDRVAFVRNHAQTSPHADTPPTPEQVEMYARMKAKLAGFLEPGPRVLSRYRADDRSIEARYARAIAYFKRAEMTQALPLIDGLIEERPEDPFFHELRGQMLYETGRLREALPSYRKAQSLAPDEPLIRINLARVLLDIDEPGYIEEARTHMSFALNREPTNAAAWRIMAIAHGRAGDMGLAAYALAEYNLHRGDPDEALRQVQRAEGLLSSGSSAWLRLQDVRQAAERARQRRR